MKKIFFALLISFCLSSLFAQRLETDIPAKTFQFKFKKNDQSRILSTVQEDVYLNGRFNHTAVILNRISSVITETDENGSGTAEAVFMTSENSSKSWNNRIYTWGEEYESIFTRD